MTYDNTIDETQEYIMDRIREYFPQKLIETAMPTSDTTPRDEQGMLDPYITVQFGDLQQEGHKNMATSMDHGYVIPFYIGCVAPTARVAQRIANRINVKLLGFSAPNSGQVEKRAGGMIYSLPAQMGAVELYVAPASFKVHVEVREL